MIVRKNDANTVKQIRSYHSADCNTDHLLIIAKVEMITQKKPRSEKPRKPKINTENTKDPTMMAKFQELA